MAEQDTAQAISAAESLQLSHEGWLQAIIACQDLRKGMLVQQFSEKGI